MQREHLAADQFYGQGIESLFPEGSAPVRSTPWPRAARRKDIKDYDAQRVSEALRQPPRLEEVDPRDLHATQPNITRPGVDYYSGAEYHQTGRTYEAGTSLGNRYPLVYHRQGLDNIPPQKLLLSGHHRGTAALVKGEPLRAIVVEGPWGERRR